MTKQTELGDMMGYIGVCMGLMIGTSILSNIDIKVIDKTKQKCEFCGKTTCKFLEDSF